MPKKRYQQKMVSRDGIPGIRGLVILIIGLAALSGSALAHPPASAALTYDNSSGDLVVVITHQVDNPDTHYVKQVTVKQGTAVLIEKSYTSQPDKSLFTYRYNLPQLKWSSAEVKVDVECSQFGSRSGTLTLSGTTAPDTSTGQPAPLPTKAAALPLIVVLAAGIPALRILRKSL